MREVYIRQGKEVIVFDNDRLIVTVTRYPEGDYDIMYEDLDRETSNVVVCPRKKDVVKYDDLFDRKSVREKLSQLDFPWK